MRINKLIFPALMLSAVVLPMKTAFAEELIHQDGEPATCEVSVEGNSSSCNGFTLIERDDFYLFAFSGVSDSDIVLFVTSKNAMNIETEDYSSAESEIELYPSGLLVINAGDSEDLAREEISGVCAWRPPSPTGGFGGWAQCRQDISDSSAPVLEYWGTTD